MRDGLVYTFKLRDAKWSDGTPVTAGDFVFLTVKLVDPKEGHVAQSADVFKNAKKIRSGELSTEELGVKAIDDKTLEITLENPAPYLPKLLTGSRFLPQSEKVAKEKRRRIRFFSRFNRDKRTVQIRRMDRF